METRDATTFQKKSLRYTWLAAASHVQQWAMTKVYALIRKVKFFLTSPFSVFLTKSAKSSNHRIKQPKTARFPPCTKYVRRSNKNTASTAALQPKIQKGQDWCTRPTKLHKRSFPYPPPPAHRTPHLTSPVTISVTGCST